MTPGNRGMLNSQPISDNGHPHSHQHRSSTGSIIPEFQEDIYPYATFQLNDKVLPQPNLMQSCKDDMNYYTKQLSKSSKSEPTYTSRDVIYLKQQQRLHRLNDLYPDEGSHVREFDAKLVQGKTPGSGRMMLVGGNAPHDPMKSESEEYDSLGSETDESLSSNDRINGHHQRTKPRHNIMPAPIRHNVSESKFIHQPSDQMLNHPSDINNCLRRQPH